MTTNIFMPKTIKVGFQKRSDTYTKQLAYIIYYDETGKLRKENSWNSWRDNKIEPLEFQNEPLEGFVLNKKAGDYSSGWNHRQAYVRVYDPRGFEFEITIENLLYILENTNSIKGKGLEGEFVYGWHGKDLVLIPISSPDYQEIININKIKHMTEFIKAKELKIGATYINKDNKEFIYMGRFEHYNNSSWSSSFGKPMGKYYFFAKILEKSKSIWVCQFKSISKKFVKCVSEECVENYAELMDKLESQESYSPYDETKDEIVFYTLEEFKERIKDKWGCVKFFDKEKRKVIIYFDKNEQRYYKYPDECYGSEEEVYGACQPIYINKYLKNGKFYMKEEVPRW